MSKVTNPDTESSVTCGFFNALNHDRLYDAVQMCEIFDGILTDGIFSNIGTCFVVKADSGNLVDVGVGRAWFNHSWIKNDAILPVTCTQAEVLLDRIDAVVIEINHSETIRDDFIKVIDGTPSSEPVNPTLSSSDNVYQYPLCYIYRKAGSTEITQADITNCVGTESTPFAAGVMTTINLDELLGQWQDELDQFVASETADFDADYQVLKENMEAAAAVITAWTSSEQKRFTDWFDSIKRQLSEDQAGHLQNEIDAANVEAIINNGFMTATKVFSGDGTTITSTSGDADTLSWTLTKVFTDSFQTATTTLADENSVVIATLVKQFSADGKSISSVYTYNQ